jgi:hypothetical protein
MRRIRRENSPASMSTKLPGSGSPVTQAAARSARAERGRELAIAMLRQNLAESRATVLAGSTNVTVANRWGKRAAVCVASQPPYECPTKCTSLQT